jgi:hypothetical protein
MTYFCHFFIVKDMNAIRIGLATAIAFYATRFLYEKRSATFLFLVVAAAFFHVSALLLLVPAMLIKLQPNRTQLVITAISVVLIAAFFHLSQLISSLVSVGFVSYKLALYSGAAMYNYSLSLFDIVNTRNLVLTAFCLYFWNDLRSFDKKFEFCFYFFLCGVLFRIIFHDFAIVAGRGYASISMFEYIIIPSVFMYLFGGRWGYVSIFAFSLLTMSLDLFVNTSWSGGVRYFG